MEEGKKTQKKRNGLSASFVTGAIALVFLIIGYQVALFVHKAAALRLAANRDHPDTVYVIDRALAAEVLSSGVGAEGALSDETSAEGSTGRADGRPLLGAGTGEPPSAVTVRRNAPHSPAVTEAREKAAPRQVESFRFNPNTVSVEDLQRLGFSVKQAQAIENYRLKGGRFRRPEDFAKSFVVADSVYKRLAPFIHIPRLDINRADSLALLSLPGIGPYYAGKVVEYRGRLGGFSCPEQLLEIYRFDREKYDGLRDLITCSEPTPYPLWELPEADLARHPHISKAEAHGILLYRQHNPPERCTLEGLLNTGVLSQEHYARLSLCRISPAK